MLIATAPKSLIVITFVVVVIFGPDPDASAVRADTVHTESDVTDHSVGFSVNLIDPSSGMAVEVVNLTEIG